MKHSFFLSVTLTALAVSFWFSACRTPEPYWPEQDTADHFGPATPAPAPGQGLSTFGVRKTIEDHMPALEHCYTRAIKHHPGLSGKIIFGVQITTAGRIKSLNIIQDTIAHASLTQCLESQLKKLRFEKADNGFETHVEYPFVFVPKE